VALLYADEHFPKGTTDCALCDINQADLFRNIFPHKH
jgi:hypothetical protein